MSEKINVRLKSRLQWLVVCNRLLLIVSIGCVLYAALTFSLQKRSAPSMALQKNFSKIKDDKSEKIVLPEPKPFDAYSGIIARRDIFSILQRAENPVSPGSQTEVPQVSLKSTQDWIGNFKLVGIFLDGEPKAVIEDSQKNETFFLSRGQQLNEAVLEDIQEGKVVFTYQGHRVELAF